MVRPMDTLLQEAISYFTARPHRYEYRKDARVRSIGTPLQEGVLPVYSATRPLRYKNTILRPMHQQWN